MTATDKGREERRGEGWNGTGFLLLHLARGQQQLQPVGVRELQLERLNVLLGNVLCNNTM